MDARYRNSTTAPSEGSDENDLAKDNTDVGDIRRRNQLLEWDEWLTSRMAVCASKDSPLGNMRQTMKLLEISCHGVPFLIFTVVALLHTHLPLWQQIYMNLLFALILDLVIVGSTKAIFRRPRPRHNNMDMFATISVDNFSFPSGHATRAAMVACFFASHLSPTFSFLLCTISWAVLVCLSRILLGRHHVLDVLCGSVIGILEYKLVTYFWISEQTCVDIMTPIHEEIHM